MMAALRSHVPARYRLVFAAAGVALAISTLTRLVLGVFLVAGPDTPIGGFAAAFAVGLVFDLVVALGLTLPLALHLAVVPKRWWRGRFQRRLWFGGLFAFTFGLLFVGAAEYFFFDEFSSRFNFVAADYLLYPTEVGENIWQSYPTGWILFSIALVSAAVVVTLRPRVAAAFAGGDRPRRRFAAVGLHLLVFAGAVALVSTRWTLISPDRSVNQLAGNGCWAFVEALTGRDAPYQGVYAELDPADAVLRLRRMLAEPALTELPANPLAARHIRPLGPARQPNVVIVLEESFGAEYVGALHPREVSLTPQLDALIPAGTLLTRAYSTGNRTIRAIEATTTGLPPLPGSSLVRRAQSKGLFTLPALLRDRGYDTSFLYGGRALFDGMGGYLTANGVDRIVDQGDFPAEAFRTAWGVADEDLFDRAITEMDALHARNQPFFSLVLTVSNHRPYLFPEEHFQPLPGLHRRKNAVRYADHALGRFIREAQRHPFFADTLFVLMGDHGARVYGAAEVPLASYEIPILFLGAGVEPGRRIDTLASSLDVPPTILGLMGLSYDSKFFGQDVFRAAPAKGRAFFVHNNNIGMLRGADIAVLGLHQSSQAYRIDGDDLFKLPVQDEVGRELIADTIAAFESVDRVYRSGGYRFEAAALDAVVAAK